MLAQMMTKHILYSVAEAQNPDTYETEQAKMPVKDFDIAITESGYQEYVNSNLDLERYNYVGFTFESGLAKGMYVDDMEIVHVLPSGRQFVVYLKAVK